MLVNVFSKKKTVNFKRFYAFAQIALFYALPMLKKISRILKLPSWQHCTSSVTSVITLKTAFSSQLCTDYFVMNLYS